MNPTYLAAKAQTMPTWSRRAVYIAAGALFLAGLGMSGYYLTMLAMWLGVSGWVAWLLPVALDAGAVVGVVMWVTSEEDSEVHRYGRTLARQMVAASIVGNALDRALTFAPGPTSPIGLENRGLELLLDRTRALFELLNGPDGVAAGVLLLVSMALGIVFPVLAYRMAHALILVRKEADAGAPRTVADVVTPPAPAPGPRTAEEPARELPARPTPDPSLVPATAHVDTGPIRTVPAALDLSDYEPGSPEWTRRYEALDGDTKTAKAEAFLRLAWKQGEEPVLLAVDRAVGGNRIASRVKSSLRDRDILPPSEQVARDKVLDYASV